MAAGGLAAGAALEVIGGREDHQVAFEVVVFGFELRRGLVRVHPSILSFLPFLRANGVRKARRESIARIEE